MTLNLLHTVVAEGEMLEHSFLLHVRFFPEELWRPGCWILSKELGTLDWGPFTWGSLSKTQHAF